MSRTFLATLHFDGTGFVGWQRQPAGRSVQAEFERVLERLFGAHAAASRRRSDRRRSACGRARRQLRRSRPVDRHPPFAARSTPCCPRTAGSREWIAMQAGFHARKSALTRRYRYDIGTDDAAASPFRRPFEWALVPAARAAVAPRRGHAAAR